MIVTPGKVIQLTSFWRLALPAQRFKGTRPFRKLSPDYTEVRGFANAIALWRIDGHRPQFDLLE